MKAALILLLFIILCYAIRRERKDWNNGICPICGHELRHFGCDSQDGDGWTCDYTTWVSYHKFVYRK